MTPGDLKFIFVLLIFIFLHMWSFVVDILLFYVSEDKQCLFLQNKAVLALQFIAVRALSQVTAMHCTEYTFSYARSYKHLLYYNINDTSVHHCTVCAKDRSYGTLVLSRLLQNVGDSSQGLANGILFCACTRIVRNKLAAVMCCHGSCCHGSQQRHRATVMSDVSSQNHVTFEDTAELLEESLSRTLEVQPRPYSSLIPVYLHWGRGRPASVHTAGDCEPQSEAMYHGL